MVEVKEAKKLVFKIPSEDLDKIDYICDFFNDIKIQIRMKHSGDFRIRNVRTGEEVSKQDLNNLLRVLDVLTVFDDEDEFMVE